MCVKTTIFYWVVSSIQCHQNLVNPCTKFSVCRTILAIWALRAKISESTLWNTRLSSCVGLHGSCISTGSCRSVHRNRERRSPSRDLNSTRTSLASVPFPSFYFLPCLSLSLPWCMRVCILLLPVTMNSRHWSTGADHQLSLTAQYAQHKLHKAYIV